MGLQFGLVLLNRYQIRRELGIGGMGRVYLAADETLGTVVAIKVLRDLLSRDPGSVQRLKKEARLAMQLSHPNIVRVHDYHEAEIIKFLVMEYVEGETLAHRVARETTLSEAEARRMAIAICQGLEHAHEKRIIHRDLKPGNILLGKDGAIKIADFGIARVCRDSMSRLTSQLDSGTLTYMSPEQLMGESTEQSDVYSLGVILYELLSGEVPFHSGDIQAQIKEKYPKPLADVSAEMNSIVLKCLVKLPEGRPAGVRGLREYLDGKPPAVLSRTDVAKPVPAAPEIKPKPTPPLEDHKQSAPAVVLPPPHEAPPVAKPGLPISAPEPRREPDAAAKAKGGALRGLAGRGALGFGLGSAPAGLCVMLYLYGICGIWILVFAFAAIVIWGVIGARALRLGKRGVWGFASGFLIAAAILIPGVERRARPGDLVMALGFGLLIAGALSSAIMRRGKRVIILGIVAFGAFPFLAAVLWQLIASTLSWKVAFIVVPVLAGALSGALFGAVLPLWERQDPRTGSSVEPPRRQDTKTPRNI